MSEAIDQLMAEVRALEARLAAIEAAVPPTHEVHGGGTITHPVLCDIAHCPIDVDVAHALVDRHGFGVYRHDPDRDEWVRA